MQQHMFVIYDSKANAFMTPWFLTTQALAVRAFSDLANDPESNVSRHPDDYTLFTIGTFNDQTAKIHWEEPKTLGNAIQFKKTQQTEEQPDMFFDDEPTTPHAQTRAQNLIDGE